MMDREGVQARDNKRPRSARLSPARELAPPKMAREERCFVIGVDGGTESIRAGVFTPRGELVATCSSEYPTHFPNPGWAEQHPEDWWRCMGEAVRGALGTGGVNAEEIKGISLTSTCCTVCVLDSQGRAMRPALLWMDMRSANETRRVLATGDPALEVNSAGCGPVSAEWMVPKALWISANEPALFRDCAMVCEYQDYINLHLTGRYCASVNNVSIRWHYSKKHGWPLSLLGALGIPELADKWPKDVLALGDLVGGLTKEAAQHLGLLEGTPVAQGGADAFVGMVGLGVLRPGQMALLTGSSHLHLGMSESAFHRRGVWGTYEDAVVPGVFVVEGGQTSTGSVVSWFKRTFAPETPYATLDQEAAEAGPGSSGLLCLEHWQGNRTPHTDALSRGTLTGLTLSHSRGHVFRSLMEGVAFGTREILETMERGGFRPAEIVVAGGAVRSGLWLKIHADVTGVPLKLTQVPDACSLGAAVLAAVGAGLYASVKDGADAMVRVVKEIEPDRSLAATYDNAFAQYRQLYPSLKGVFHRLPEVLRVAARPSPPTNGAVSPPRVKVAASILAADCADLGREVSRALTAGCDWIHIDITDNTFAPGSIAFGPPIVASLRKMHPACFLDCHLAVAAPQQLFQALAEAGASQVTFHMEAVEGDTERAIFEEAKRLCLEIRGLGMRSSVSLKPSTDARGERYACVTMLVAEGVVDCVDVLAVEPGFGGQEFQPHVLDTVEELRGICEMVDIQVDGGVKPGDIARRCVDAGCNVLVAGTAIFGAADMAEAVRHLRGAADGGKTIG